MGRRLLWKLLWPQNPSPITGRSHLGEAKPLLTWLFLKISLFNLWKLVKQAFQGRNALYLEFVERLSSQSSQYALDKKMVHDKLGEAFAVQVCNSLVLKLCLFILQSFKNSRLFILFFSLQAALSTDRNFFDFFHLSPLKVSFPVVLL